MYILKPVLHETIWGGNRLIRYTDIKDKKIGHLYMVNGHEEMSNTLLNGPDKGHTLWEIFQKNRSLWNLSEFEEFPLTIALVDASDDLSIQVHPDDEIAELLEKKKIGKKESWIFLEAPAAGWIYGGCECDSIEEIRNTLSEGKIQEIAGHLPTYQDSYVCMEAGTLHAMTRGSLVYEIEYGSDFTYRFYDYDRIDAKGKKRELHLEKAICSIKPQNIPHVVTGKNSQWISEDVYEVVRRDKLFNYINQGTEMECISILDGVGKCDGIRVSGGMSILLLPGEKIENVQFKDIVIARLVR